MRPVLIFLIAVILMPKRELSAQTIPAISDNSLSTLDHTYSNLTTAIDKQTKALLKRMQSKETQLRKELQNKDSATATRLFNTGASAIQQLKAGIQTPVTNPVNSLRNYIPGIDSMTTAIKFLSATGLPADKLQKLQAIGRHLQQLRGSLQNANDVQDLVTQREAQWNDQLSRWGLAKQLSGMNKEMFYYQQQLQQYKNILNDETKQQQVVLAALRQLPAFQSFWQKNSMLSQLFPDPGNTGTLLAGAGLQTSSQVGNIIQQRLGTALDDGGTGAAQYLQQHASEAQGQMDDLRQRLDDLHLSGGSSDMTLPDFSPNGQKKKTLWQRLEYGVNMQNAGGTPLLPAISTLGLSLGYRLNDKITIGTGLSYLLGLGNGINHIALSNQGVGLRSYVDIKAKGSLWITGGYEYNYMQQFAKLSDIRDLDIWQRSALVGLTKKYKVGRREGNFQLLYDLLASYERPAGQPLKLRFGYTF